MIRLSFSIIFCLISFLFADNYCYASQNIYLVDDNPIQIAPGTWRFRINLGVRPTGTLGFVNSQYDFGSRTDGINVDYDFNGTGIDFTDGRSFYGISTTLHIAGQPDFLNGWNVVDLDDGIFSGTVYATAPLVRVYFGVESENFVPVAPPSVITVDGTHIISVINPSYPPDATHYLYDAIDPYWTGLIESRVGPITHFDWSRNIYDTDDYVLYLSAVLEGLTKSNKRNHSPLVVVSHSWGTVLAYIAISRNKNIVVDKFVTLGSPLNAQNGTVNAFTKETLARWNINKISSPHNVRTWTNYWAQCDPISGSIPATKGNIMITTNYIDNEFLTCHGAYYADYGVWQDILFDVYLTK